MPRSPQHLLLDLTELAARLPWWAWVLSALAAYAVLQPIAMLHMPAPVGTLDMAATALAEIFLTLARLGLYLLPPAFLLAAGVSAFVHWKRLELSAALASDATGTLLRGISRADFQVLVGEAFRRQGYQAREPHGAAQAGYDLDLARDGRRYLVQCRHWKAWQVDVEAVRELSDAMAAGVHGGFVVISGHFTPEAQAFAQAHGIALVDGRRLKELVRRERETPLGAMAFYRDRVRPALGSLRGLIRLPGRPAYGTATAPGTGLAAGGDAAHPPSRPAPDEDAERAFGRDLAALIRAERRAPEGLPAVAAPARPPNPKRRRAFKPSAGRTADAIGVLIALAGGWWGYLWFAGLPDQPAMASWTLLGRAGSVPDSPVQRLQEVIRIASGQGSRGPIGQYRFGPDRIEAPPATGAPPPGGEAADRYRTVQQLEAAFNAKYIPPAECNEWQSGAQMARCGNHRMRTRRAFIASGGRMTAALFGGPEEPVAPPAQGWREDGQGDRSQGLVADWRQEAGQEAEQDWRPQWGQVDGQGAEPESQDAHPGYRQSGWGRDASPDPQQDWRRAWLEGAPDDSATDWREAGRWDR